MNGALLRVRALSAELNGMNPPSCDPQERAFTISSLGAAPRQLRFTLCFEGRKYLTSSQHHHVSLDQPILRQSYLPSDRSKTIQPKARPAGPEGGPNTPALR
jgi:hypothetical protein